MLKLMREHASSFIIKFLLFAIAIVFAFWGVGNFRSPKTKQIAIVNGETITMAEYRNEYNRMVQRYRQFGGNLNDNMVKMIEKQALDSLIDQSLMRQEAQRLDIHVSDEELFEAIQNIEAFKTSGIFDKQMFKRILRANRLTPEDFKNRQKDAMVVEKLRSFILSSVKVSDEEVKEWFNWNNASMKIDYMLFESSKYKDIEPSEEELNSYFEKHRGDYMTEPQVKAQFLSFNPESYKSKVTLSDEEIRDYYDEHLDMFKTEKTVQARHILLKLEKDSPADEVEKKKQKAIEIMKMAKEGQDFAELAKTYSEGPTKDKGGDLGAFKQGDMVKPFSDKAFSMKTGEISEPVQTQFGWHIIKVEKINDASIRSLDEAKEEIRKTLTDRKTKDLAYDDAEAVYDSIFEGDNLTQAAQDQEFEIKTTDFFTRKQGPKTGVKNRNKFVQATFKLSQNEISDIEDLGDGYYLIQMIEKIPEKQAEFEDVKNKVKRDFIKEKQDEKAKKEAEEFLAAVKAGESISSVCEKQGLTLNTTDFFKRTDSQIPGIGYERELSQAAFKLSEQKKVPDELIKSRKGYFVIAFKEKKMPDEQTAEKEKVTEKEKLLQQKKFKIFNQWLSQLKEENNVSIKADFLND